MKAISIRQPWPWAILFAGKDIENRDWATNFLGRILIHAAKEFDQAGYNWLRDKLMDLPGAPDLPHPDHFPRGGIIGSVEITGCVIHSTSSWFFGRHGFLLARPKRLPFRAQRGMPGIFDVTDNYLPPEYLTA